MKKTNQKIQLTIDLIVRYFFEAEKLDSKQV